LREFFGPWNKHIGHPIFERLDSAFVVWAREKGNQVLQSGAIRGGEENKATAGFGGGLEGFEGFADRDAADMDRDGFGEIEIGDEFKSRLLGERAQDSGDWFLFEIKGDGSPPAGCPEPEPEEGEKADEGKKHLRTIHKSDH
jgi:hypothetical protein